MVGLPRWSLDELLDLFSGTGATGLWIVPLAGFGGAVALLAACWRPPAKVAE